MAANPFDAFDAPATPAAKANPFDAFDAPTSSAPSSSPAAPNANAYQPPTWLPGAGWLHDISAMVDPSYGLMDKLFGKQAQADTAASTQRLGAAALPISLVSGMATGGPELAGARAIGEAAAPYIGKWAGGALGSGIVGAGSAGLGAYGHEEGWTPDAGDIGRAAAIGGGLGLGAGALGGGAQPVRPPPQIGPALAAGAKLEAPTSAGLLAKSQALYGQAGNQLFDNADIRQAATNAISEINQQPARIARNGQGALSTLNKIGNNYALGPGVQSGEDLNDFVNSLKVAKTGDDVDVAGRIGQKHMQNVLDNVTPSVGQPGAAGDIINQAKQAFGRSADLERLEGDPTRAMIQKTQGNYQPGDPEYQAADAALTAMQPRFSWYGARHILAPIAGAGLLGAEGYINPAEGQNPWISGGREALEGALLFKGLKSAAAARPEGAINALRYAVGTGQAQPAAAAPWRDALRMLTLGSGGSYR